MEAKDMILICKDVEVKSPYSTLKILHKFTTL